MKSRRASSAFTLIELLTVIGILVLLAALAAPVITNFRKGDAMLAATRQMLDAVHRGRQLAISQHTTVYMVFAPPTLSADPAFNSFVANPTVSWQETNAAMNILDRQQTGYAYVSLRTVGDQPGRGTPRYLTSWQSLPESSFIPSWKFTDPKTTQQIKDPVTGNVLFNVTSFDRVNFVPFPSEDAKYHNPALYNPPASVYTSLP